MRRKKTNIDTRVFERFEEICRRYSVRSSEDNLNALLDVYQILIPNWKGDFNRFNRRLSQKNSTNNKVFDDFLRIQLPEDYSIENLKARRNEGGNSFIDIMQRGRIIHLSNKIAHQFDFIFESRLKEFMQTMCIPIHTPEEFYEIKRLIRQRYNARTKSGIKGAAEAILISQFGFEPEDFMEGKNLDTLDFKDLIKGYNDGMYIKDTEIENVDRLVHDQGRKDVSYGLKKVDDQNTLFVMDIQKFGQFSVHVKDPNLISQIRVRYRMPLYRRETSLLVDHMSDKAKEFLEAAKTDDSLDEERRIPRYVSDARKQRERLTEEIKFLDLTGAEKHELAVKGGLIRGNLEEIDNSKEER